MYLYEERLEPEPENENKAGQDQGWSLLCDQPRLAAGILLNLLKRDLIK